MTCGICLLHVVNGVDIFLRFLKEGTSSTRRVGELLDNPVQQEHLFIPNVYHIYAGYPGQLHYKGLAPLNFIEHSTESLCRPRSRNPHREAIQLRRNDKSVVRSWYTCGRKIHAPTYIGELVMKEWGEQRRNKVEQLRYFLVGSHLEKNTKKHDKLI